MKRLLLACLVLILSPPFVHAQRDAPVWESHLASVSICHTADRQVSMDLLYAKSGGPHEHTEHQMYLIAYLKKDEGTILKLASDASLLDKKKRDKKMLMEVLKDKCLVAVLDSKVAQRTEDDTFPFHFSFRYSDLFAKIKTLKNFELTNTTPSDGIYFNDQFKIIVFVPVNDSRYADKVAPHIRSHGDFVNIPANNPHPDNSDLHLRTPLLYFKPLPYEFQFVEFPLINASGNERVIFIN